MKIMKSKSFLALSLVATLSVGMFSFANANVQSVQKSKIVVAETKEFQKLNTNKEGLNTGYILAWTKGASSAILVWEF